MKRVAVVYPLCLLAAFLIVRAFAGPVPPQGSGGGGAASTITNLVNGGGVTVTAGNPVSLSITNYSSLVPGTFVASVNGSTGTVSGLATTASLPGSFVASVNGFTGVVTGLETVRLNVSTITSSANSTVVDFTGARLQTLALGENTTFSSANLQSGRAVTVRITCDGTERTLAFPAVWTFVGSNAPVSIITNKIAILSLISFTNADAGVVAGYATQP